MKEVLFIPKNAVLYFLLWSFSADAQVADSASTAQGLFDTDSILTITLSGNVREILNDRSDNPVYRKMLLSYTNEDNAPVSIHTEVKTRGHFRKLRNNCSYPPLQIYFSDKSAIQSTPFREQNKIKLVLPCRGDEYVIREWLVYKLYNLVTPKSFRARLVHVTLEDAKNKKTGSPFYGILLEEEKQMAKRNKMITITRKLKPEQTHPDYFITMAVFQFLIGNTDWSVQYLQNIKLLARDSTTVPVTVPYDFDHAGIVSAPYAKPAPELDMGSVRERRYRGYCIKDMTRFDSTIALYNSIRESIYSTYTNCPLLDAGYIKSTVKYLDEFYAVINNPTAMNKKFSYPCDKFGTGNVIIKGLRED